MDARLAIRLALVFFFQPKTEAKLAKMPDRLSLVFAHFTVRGGVSSFSTGKENGIGQEAGDEKASGCIAMSPFVNTHVICVTAKNSSVLLNLPILLPQLSEAFLVFRFCFCEGCS